MPINPNGASCATLPRLPRANAAELLDLPTVVNPVDVFCNSGTVFFVSLPTLVTSSPNPFKAGIPLLTTPHAPPAVAFNPAKLASTVLTPVDAPFAAAGRLFNASVTASMEDSAPLFSPLIIISNLLSAIVYILKNPAIC